VIGNIGGKVTLNCTSPSDNPSSVDWFYESSSVSNDSTILVRIEEGKLSVLDASGRLSVNRSLSNSYFLVIYGVQQNDSGKYVCSVDVGYKKQHVTFLNVIGKYSYYFTEYLFACYVFELISTTDTIGITWKDKIRNEQVKE